MAEHSVIAKVDIPIEELKTPEEKKEENKAKGDLEAKSIVDLGGKGFIGTFGIGGA